MRDALSIFRVIDLCPREGTCAMACLRKIIPYCGIINDQHSARLLAHLEKSILNNVTMMGEGSLYDVRCANAVAGNAPTSYSSGAAAAKPKDNLGEATVESVTGSDFAARRSVS